jgi:hypothetical protein
LMSKLVCRKSAELIWEFSDFGHLTSVKNLNEHGDERRRFVTLL